MQRVFDDRLQFILCDLFEIASLYA
jgi:hypothetical protein